MADAWVREGQLQADGQPIMVGSAAWFAWLAQAERFRYEGPAGRFGARRERFQRGGWYWKAYRRVGGRLRRAYLGRAEDLTYERLEHAAAALAEGEKRPVHIQATESPPLLWIKLTPPALRPGVVERERMLDELDSAALRPLTLVTCPAGWGKTTLLAGWAERRRKQGAQIAWLSLDQADDDPARLWSYVCAALGAHESAVLGAGAALRASRITTPEQLLTGLINALVVRLGPPLVLILDDIHHLTNPDILGALAFLVEHMPARLRLILASRSELALPLARWRAAGLIAELRMAELRFDLSESTALLAGAAGRPLSEGNVRALAERTEGWAAGLHLAGLALRAAGGEPHDLIGQVAGSHPYIRDYLVDEILRRESPEIQRFLLQTSILEQMCGELCDALVGDPRPKTPDPIVQNRRTAEPLNRLVSKTEIQGIENQGTKEQRSKETSEDYQVGMVTLSPGHLVTLSSSIVLEELERRGLFVTALDGERRWFRYHTLFAEALRAVLGRVYPALVATLHERAFGWLAAHGGIERTAEAIGHAQAAGLHEAAADLLERRTDELIWMRGEIQTLRRLTGRLPSEVVLARPQLALMECWTLLVSIQLDTLDARLRRLAAAHGPAVAGEIAGIRSFVVRISGNCQGAIELGRLALELISPQRTIVQHVIRMSLESTYFMVGDLNAAEQVAADLHEHLGDGPIPPFLLIAGVGLSKADLLMRRARPCEAEQFLRAALTEAERRSSGVLTSTGMILAMLSEARYAQGELGDAEQLARAALAEGERWYNTDMRLMAQDHLGRALRALGDIAGAEALAATSRDLVRSYYRVPYINSWARIGDATDAFLRGDPAPAEQALADHGVHVDGPLDPAEFDAYVLLARVNLARGRIDAAAGLVARLRALAEQGGYTMRVILADMLRAQIEQVAGRQQEACSILERALGAAMPGGVVQCFVDEGEPMRQLLEQWMASSLAHPSADLEQLALQKRLQVYGVRLLRKFPGTETAMAGEAPLQQGRDKEVRSRRLYLPFGGEQLTMRELEVLRLVAIGRSNQAIAQLLTISLHTVKKHMTSVLEKLRAESRTAAVVRARELGIV